MYMPGFTIFAKLAELMNETPLWTSSCDRLELIEPLALRCTKWILNVLKFMILLAVSVAPSNVEEFRLLEARVGLSIVSAILELFLSAVSASLDHSPFFRKQAEKATVTSKAQELQMVKRIKTKRDIEDNIDKENPRFKFMRDGGKEKK
jgi:hypothetical protein